MAFAQEKIYTEEDYYKMPEGVRAELIDGKIYYQAPPGRIHQEILMFLAKTIANYIDEKGGPCRVYPGPFAVKLFQNHATIVEPDISVICNPDKLTSRGCSGAPDWIIEIISPSNSGNDYIRKLNLYMDAGVREYWIVNPSDCTVFVYRLAESKFENISYSFHERIQAGIYEDLFISLKVFEQK